MKRLKFSGVRKLPPCPACNRNIRLGLRDVEFGWVHWHCWRRLLQSQRLLAQTTSQLDQLFQTRSEETGMAWYATFAEAEAAATTDPSIWKISFAMPDGTRCRLVLEPPGRWVFSPIILVEEDS